MRSDNRPQHDILSRFGKMKLYCTGIAPYCTGIATECDEPMAKIFQPARLMAGIGQLTTRAAVILRHIMIMFNISVQQAPLLTNAYACLLNGQPPPKEEVFSKSTLRNHMTRLSIIDDYHVARKYEEVFKKKQKFGFKRFWHMTTDDSKFAKHDDRHVVLRTYDSGENDDGFHINPHFDCLSTAQSKSKDMAGNVEHNVEVLKEGCLSPEVFGLALGNTVDNAAMSEGSKTIDGIHQSLKNDGKEELTQIYGVDIWSINHNDPFHCCQLGVQHATEGALGKTDKGNNRQIHHRQAMQTLHDIVIADK
ncbi:hypothetical protein ACHAXR_002265, partial [Thalassiosira sp. AJA248-18]